MEFFRDQGRRPVRAPHTLRLAAARRIDGEPPHADLGHDRQPRLPRRQSAGLRPRCWCPPARRSPSPAGLDFNDHRLIWDKLDRVHAKHPDMVLLHGGSPKGRRADRRQMGRSPQGAADRLQARLDRGTPRPHRSNATTQCWRCCRSGSWCFRARGIQDNLADKAKKLGIPVWKFGSGGA